MEMGRYDLTKYFDFEVDPIGEVSPAVIITNNMREITPTREKYRDVVLRATQSQGYIYVYSGMYDGGQIDVYIKTMELVNLNATCSIMDIYPQVIHLRDSNGNTIEVWKDLIDTKLIKGDWSLLRGNRKSHVGKMNAQEIRPNGLHLWPQDNKFPYHT